jgi:hypothetical protein
MMVMKKNKASLTLQAILIAFVLFPSIVSSQQEGGIGILAGLNFASNGDLVAQTTPITERSSRSVGYHFGLYSKVDLGLLFLRPELKYTHTKSEYTKADLTVDKLDAPLLLGIDLHKRFSLFAGPSLQYIIDTNFENFLISDATKDFTVGIQMGLGLNFEKLGIDLRYERGLSENEATFNDFTQSRVDTRPDQLILALSLSL